MSDRADVLLLLSLVERFFLMIQRLGAVFADGEVSEEELDQLEDEFNESVSRARERIRQLKG